MLHEKKSVSVFLEALKAVNLRGDMACTTQARSPLKPANGSVRGRYGSFPRGRGAIPRCICQGRWTSAAVPQLKRLRTSIHVGDRLDRPVLQGYLDSHVSRACVGGRLQIRASDPFVCLTWVRYQVFSEYDFQCILYQKAG